MRRSSHRPSLGRRSSRSARVCVLATERCISFGSRRKGAPRQSMNSELLSIYLQDHHAASAGGVALARRALGPSHPLAKQIARDRQALERVMRQLAVTPSALKVGTVRLAELVGRLKLNGRIFERSPLSSVIELEGLVVGVRGKEALWTALRRAGISLDGRRPRCAGRLRTNPRSRAGGASPECCIKSVRRVPRGNHGR